MRTVRKTRWWATAALALFAVCGAQAQELRSDSTVVPYRFTGDTLKPVARNGAQTDTVRGIPFKGKSPGTAMLLSAVLPGAGQFYNESYWKVPIVAGLGIYFVSEWLSNNRRFRSSQDAAAAYNAAHQVNPTATESAYLDYLISVREFYHDQRDSFAWYYLILYVVNLADAYVDASLFGFDVGGSLSMNGMPQPRLTLRWRF